MTSQRFGFTLFACGVVATIVAILVWLSVPNPEKLISNAIHAPTPTVAAEAANAAPPAKDTFVEKVQTHFQRVQELKARIRSQYETPFSFYGRVTDENGTPISGARAEITWADTSERGTSTVELLSDGNGLFSLLGAKGKSGTVRVSKAGFHTRDDMNRRAFDLVEQWNPEFYKPDEKSPRIFILQKALTAEPMLHWKKSYHFRAKEGVVFFDLLGASTTDREKADLLIKYSADRLGLGLPYYNWSCEITVFDGGLVDRSNGFALVAPEKGYSGSASIVMQAEAEAYQWSAEREYFVRMRGGQAYGRIIVKMIVGDDPFVIVTAFVNPSASRNMEYDPAKQAAAGK